MFQIHWIDYDKLWATPEPSTFLDSPFSYIGGIVTSALDNVEDGIEDAFDTVSEGLENIRLGFHGSGSIKYISGRPDTK